MNLSNAFLKENDMKASSLQIHEENVTTFFTCQKKGYLIDQGRNQNFNFVKMDYINHQMRKEYVRGTADFRFSKAYSNK